MGGNKRYRGYKSYSYLDRNEDFRFFNTVDQLNRVRSSIVELSKEEETRVNELVNRSIMISLHDHSRLNPADLSEYRTWVKENHIETGYEGLAKSGLDAVFDGLLNGSNYISSKYPWKWDALLSELGMRLCDIDHQDFVIVGKRVEDIKKAHSDGKLAFIPTVEGAMPIENELDRVDILYGFGVRGMGITYSESNALGSGLKEDRDGGLTEFGHNVVDRMNKLGMAIDLAHSGDLTSLDTIETSRAPVFITHSGARGLWPTKRMKPDEVIKALAEKGGVIGIEAAPHTTLTKKNIKHNINSVMEHVEYIIDLVGIDHVALGPDTNFGDHVGLHHLNAKELSIGKAHAGVDFEEVEFVDGLENPSQFHNIARWLVKHGYSDQEVQKIVGGNILRVLNKAWK